ncbi:MAG TPA: leucine-rich repeat domain-containing protein, partial [Gammaproteobacteria bacterium]
MPIEFTSRSFNEGFWYYRPGENFPPPGLSDPAAYNGGEKLSIIGAASASPKDQAKLTGRWVQVLPTLKNVRILWISNKVSQAMFEAVCEMRGLEALWLKGSGIKSLESVLKLEQLQCLHIGSSTRLESIVPLPHLKQLKWLELENI